MNGLGASNPLIVEYSAETILILFDEDGTPMFNSLFKIPGIPYSNLLSINELETVNL
jgi:hypothetical protein